MFTQKEVREQFKCNYETGILTRRTGRHCGKVAGTLRKSGYIYVHMNDAKYGAHAVVWMHKYGYLPEHDIDHKDRVRHHNWIDNLEEKTRSCNIMNSAKRNMDSPVKGVHRKGNSWRAEIKIDNKNYYLKTCKSLHEAICYRLAAEQCIGVDHLGGDNAASYFKNVS